MEAAQAVLDLACASLADAADRLEVPLARADDRIEARQAGDLPVTRAGQSLTMDFPSRTPLPWGDGKGEGRRLQAALGASQLRRLPAFLERRIALAARYDRLLAPLPLVLPKGVEVSSATAAGCPRRTPAPSGSRRRPPPRRRSAP